MTKTSKDPEDILQTVRDLCASGDFAAARKHLDSAGKAVRDDFRLVDLSALLYYRSGDAASSLQEYSSYIAVSPDNAAALNNMGALLFEMQDLSGALEAFQTARGIEPRHPEVLANLAVCLKYMKSDKDCMDVYTELMREKPDFANTSRATAIEIQIACETKKYPVLSSEDEIFVIRQVAYSREGEDDMLSSTVRAADPNALAITAPGTKNKPFVLCAGVSRLLILVEKKGFFFGAPVSVLEITEQEGIVLVKVEKPEQGTRIQRRRHLRTGVGDIIRSVKPAGREAGDSLASLKFTARDLSAGGMSVFSTGAVPEETALELDLNLGRTQLSVRAEVMRNRKTEGGFEASLKFTGLSEQDHNAISCFVLSRKFERNNSDN